MDDPLVLGRELVFDDGSRVVLPSGAFESGEASVDHAGPLLFSMLRAVAPTLGLDPSEVSVSWEEEWGECEDCGSYRDDRIEVAISGEERASFRSDGHFGGGDDVGDADAMFSSCLRSVFDAEVSATFEGRVEVEFGVLPEWVAESAAAFRAANPHCFFEFVFDPDSLSAVSSSVIERAAILFRSDDDVIVSGKALPAIAAALDPEVFGSFLAAIRIDGRDEECARASDADLLGAISFRDGCSFRFATYGRLCEEAIFRKLAVPEESLPFSLRRRAASA
jgi:hypothetical protein